MSEETSEQAAEHFQNPAPKQRRKAKAKGKTKKPFVAPSEFAGMTATECCSACKPDRCLISGIGVCAHPNKTALPTSLTSDSGAVARYERAKKALAHQKIDLRQT